MQIGDATARRLVPQSWRTNIYSEEFAGDRSRTVRSRSIVTSWCVESGAVRGFISVVVLGTALLSPMAAQAGPRGTATGIRPVFPPIGVPQTPPPPLLNPGVRPTVPGPTAITPNPRSSAGLATTVMPGPATGMLFPTDRTRGRRAAPKQNRPSPPLDAINREIDHGISICRGC